MQNPLHCRRGRPVTRLSSVLFGVLVVIIAQPAWTQDAPSLSPEPPPSFIETPEPPPSVSAPLIDPTLLEALSGPEPPAMPVPVPPEPVSEEEASSSSSAVITDKIIPEDENPKEGVLLDTQGVSSEESPSDSLAAEEPAPKSIFQRATQDRPPYPPLPDFWKMSFKALQGLVIVLLLIVLTAWVLRRFGGRKLIGRPGSPGEVVGRVFLDAKNLLYLVKIQDRVLVIGRSPAGLHLMTEITDADKVRALESTKARAAGGGSLLAFPKVMEHFSAKSQTAASPPSSEMEKSLSEIRKEIERLSRFSEEIDRD